MSLDRAEVGARLRTFRKEIGLTGTALAERLGTSQSFISDIERGRSGPSGDVLTALARDFGLNVSWLLTGIGEPISGGELETVTPSERSALADELQRIAGVVRSSPNVLEMVTGVPARARSLAHQKVIELVDQVYEEGDTKKIEWLEQNIAWLADVPQPRPGIRRREYYKDKNPN